MISKSFQIHPLTTLSENSWDNTEFVMLLTLGLAKALLLLRNGPHGHSDVELMGVKVGVLAKLFVPTKSTTHADCIVLPRHEILDMPLNAL